jgi:hypothetical protein
MDRGEEKQRAHALVEIVAGAPERVELAALVQQFRKRKIRRCLRLRR